jgi:hypothetical protein
MTTITGIGRIGKSIGMTFGTFDRGMGTGQWIDQAMIEPLFFAFRMTCQAIRAVVCITLNAIVLLIHIGAVVVVAINTGKQGVVGGIGMTL